MLSDMSQIPGCHLSLHHVAVTQWGQDTSSQQSCRSEWLSGISKCLSNRWSRWRLTALGFVTFGRRQQVSSGRNHSPDAYPSHYNTLLWWYWWSVQWRRAYYLFFFKKKRNLPADLSQNFKNSNIVQFFSMLRKDNKSEQMVYYQVRQLIWVVHGCYLTMYFVRPALERIPYRKSRLLSWPKFQRHWIWC